MFWGFMEAHKQVWSMGKNNLRTTVKDLMVFLKGFPNLLSVFVRQGDVQFNKPTLREANKKRETLVNDDHKDYDRQDHCSIDGDCDDDNVDDIKNWSDQSYGGQGEEGGKEAEGKEQIQL